MIYFIKDQTRLTWGYSEAVFLFRATSLLIQPDRHEPEVVVVIILSVITANTEICFLFMAFITDLSDFYCEISSMRSHV